MTNPQIHVPVMLAEVLAALAIKNGGVYLDGTFGAGGYAAAILDAADCKLVAFDRDPEAIARGGPLKAKYGERLTLVEGRFGEMDQLSPERELD
ncbi:MAG: 16S rRNA (cytosine(1402)-N(4))-methyltransferase, partial [Proteobacteria bacterium]|nr:16S rRNA (cytosine(1402)-N(4))-methyltransferase [Pseudomonadota bacterium]